MIVQEKSRGWFEEDDVFQARIQASHAAWVTQSKLGKKVVKKATPTAAAAPSKTNAWMTSTTARPRGGPVKSSATQNKTTSGKGAGGGVFAAMMMDSDSE